MTRVEKQALRKAVRERFPGMDARSAESARLCERIIRWPVYQRARVVAGYLPLPREADVTPVLRDALASGKTLLLPRVEGPRFMTLRRVAGLEALTEGPWGLLEPTAESPVAAAEEAELLLIPLEAIDRRGMRLGKGGGYYDTLLEKTAGVTLGVALSWQLVERVPGEAWDKPLDALACSRGIQYLNGGSSR